ncbi:MAG: hypothetical protein O3C41_02520 [Bacteroidetes bacterium]|nr:hypothetical protein [Bacteroidota bacterium]MDA1175935.1 hypothetical protein [Bacteroidota bacterium]
MKTALKLLFILMSIIGYSQEFSMDLVKNMNPRNIGPGGMSGRVTSIDVVLSNPDIIYAGTASGGLWKSTSGGIKWTPIFDNQITASVGAVAVQQSNPDVIWVGTGEGNPRNSLNGGYGIYKSLDGGKTWSSMGLENTRHIHRVLIDPINPNIVYVGAIGSPWGEHPERGVFKTTDGGKTWQKILFTNNKTGVADLVMDPNNPNKLIAALWEHKREPWFFNSGGEGSGIHITYDGGENWKKISPQDGLPEGDLGRIGLAIASNKPQIVYALVEAKKNGLYKSIDGGHKWEKVSENMDEIGNRPFYYADLYVDPKNENRIYSIFTYVNVSEDGGKSFKQLMPAYGVSNGVHPDHHAWWIHPENGNFMIDGNDGGLNITKDGGSTWRFIGNLPVAQFYHISVDDEIPYNVYGGMQDNGSWRGPAYVWRDQGIRNSYWQEISFGDGFDVVPDPDNSRYGWSMSQQGFVSRYDWKTGNNYTVRPTHPNPDINLRFNWNAAINIDPVDKSTLYFGSQFVHKSTDKGETWSIISPDLTTNDPEKLRQHESGGLTMDATGAENHCTILVIEPSLVEKNMLWIGTDDGRIHYTRDGGSDWIEVTKNIKDLPKGSWITQIKASKTKKGEALLVANDYRRFNYTPYAYRTTNYGKTWKRIVDKDDTESYTLCIVEDEKEPNLMFLGTDDGLYISIDAGNEWTKWTNGFPTVSVKDLVIHPREDDLIIGTFGRAAWILDDIRPLREFAKNTKVTKDNIKLFEPPTAYMAAYQQPTGSRFGGDALYHGTNRGYGARFAYYFNSKSEEERDTVVQWDTLKLQIFDQERLIRTLKQKVPKENGIKYWTWYLDEKGVEYPSKSTTKTKREPSGTRVLKGTYKAVLNYGNLSSETSIRVENDPRLDVNDEAQRAIYLTLKRLESYLSKAKEATKQLLQSKKIAETFIKSLKETDEKGFTQEIEETEEIKGRIEELLVLFFGKVDERQGITSDPNVSVLERLGTANYYVSSRQNGVTSTEQTLIENAKSALNKALNQVNLFFETDWDKFQKQSEKINLSPFKAVKVIRLEE